MGIKSRMLAGFSLMGDSQPGNSCACLKSSLKSTVLYMGRAIANGCHCLLASWGSKTSSNSRGLRRCHPRSVCCSLCFGSFYSTRNPQPRVFKANQNPRLPGKPPAHSIALPSPAKCQFQACHTCLPEGCCLSLKMIVYKVLVV